MFVQLYTPTCAIEFNTSLVNFFTLRIIIVSEAEAVVALSVCTLPTFCKLKA